jgi:putative transposase
MRKKIPSRQEILQTIKIDGDAVRGHIDKVSRSAVEEALIQKLDAESEELCQAKLCERSADRLGTRAALFVAS